MITSDPEPGTRVDGASPVNLAIGIQATTVADPERGRARTPATRSAALEDAGFTVTRETVDGGGDDGSVVGTNPAAGSQAKKGSEVTLQISSGDNGQRPVPNVLNQEQNEAEQLLRAAGFTKVSTRNQQVLQPQFDGRVIEQSPAGGQTRRTPATRCSW